MNISELARKLKITTNQLYDALPHMGLDIGRRAVKVDNMVAQKIMKNWGQYQQTLLKKQREEEEQRILEEITPVEKKHISLPASITVRDFAVTLNIPVTKLIQVLMNNGILAALNERIDFDTASIIAEDLEFIPEQEKASEAGVFMTDSLKEVLDREPKEQLVARPPIVVIMGHVDHGKTKLLDAIRLTNVVARESGGITQHIGAYQVSKKIKKTGEEKIISFIDTPGHEAFTTMRSRGARVADIAVLVVAADDGVKPQTIEAIKIIQAASLPLLVAINKIDKPDANIDKVKRELSDNGLIPEDWGGKTVCVPVSAKEGTGIDDLLEMILLIADIEKATIVANPHGETVATVIESHIDKNEGPVATIIVQNGTLEQHDFLLVGNAFYGKVRVMRDWKKDIVPIALPSQPVKIIGLKMTPVIGDMMKAVKKLDKHVEKEIKHTASASVVVTPRRSSSKETTKSVNVILKTDTLGSLEAIANALLKIEHPEVKITIISKDLGSVTTADVLRAEATHAYIAGFHVMATSNALDIASEKKVEIKLYKIIYELIDDIKLRAESLISPEINRVILGVGRVIKVFRTESNSMIVGCVGLEGSLETGARSMILRNDHKITEGKIGKLQSGKQDIPHTKSGQEFGMLFEGKPLIQEGDIVKAFKEEKTKKTLSEE